MVGAEFSSSSLGAGGWSEWDREAYTDVDFGPGSLSEGVRDDNGLIRLHLVRKMFYEEGIIGVEELVSTYLEWAEDDEYLEFRGTNQITGETKTKWLKSRKRGNDFYRYTIKKKTEWMDEVPNKNFFSERDRDKKTSALFITFTNDQSIDFDVSWEGFTVEKEVQSGPNKGETYKAHEKNCPCVSCSWNRFMTSVRQEFGNVKVFRTYESTKSCYPHIHAVLIFEDREFDVSWKDRSAEKESEKWKLGDYKLKDYFSRNVDGEAKSLEDWWSLGYIDVQPVRRLRGVFKYLRKYLLKALTGDRDEKSPLIQIGDEGISKTLAMTWLFHKQAWAVSGGMEEFVVRLDSVQCLTQIDLEEDEVKIWEWELVRVVRCSKITNEDPPPWVIVE